MSLLPHGDDEPVVLGPDGTWTAGRLRATAAGLRAELSHAPVRPVVCRGRGALLAALAACWSDGEVALLPGAHTPERLAGLPSHPLALHDGLLDHGCDVRTLATGAPRPLPLPTGPVALLETSGSTGASVSVPKTAGQLLGEAEALVQAFGLRHQPRIVATVPGHHVYGLLFSVLLPAITGGVTCDDAPLFPEVIAARIRSLRAGVLVSVPAHLRALAAAPHGTFEGIHTVFSSGAPLSEETAAAFHAAHGLDVTEVFGSTETGGIAWRRRRLGPLWQPLPGVHIEAGPDARLLLRSPFLHPDDPSPRLGDDRVVLEADGRFQHLGRHDDVVKVASRRVSLDAVTRTLLAVPGTTDAAVLAYAAPGQPRERLHAIIASSAGDAALRRAVQEAHDAVAVPRLTRVPALPRTDTGKLRRDDLLAILDAAHGSLGMDVLTSTAHERCVRTKVPASLPMFEGHFPGDPLVPGALIVEAFVVEQVSRWCVGERVGGLQRVRFRAPLRPGDVVHATLARDGDRVAFTIRCGDSVVADGRATLVADHE